jgi:hypothetical protein
MTRHDLIVYAVTLAGLSAAALSVAAEDPIVDARAIARQTRAESPDPDELARAVARAEPAVVLARMAWLEAGPLVSHREVAAMHEVINTRMAMGGTYQRTAWQYSAGLRNPRRDGTHRLGRAALTAGWPRTHREHWPRVLAAADDAVAGRITHGCDARPLEHWGGPHVDRSSIARMLRDGMREAVCPGFANTFLVRGAP